MSFMRQLGNSDIRVSALGLGTVKVGRNQGVKYPSSFDLPSDAEVRALLAQARDLGINLLDTAPAYGISEQRLGQLLDNRHEWVIISKAGEEFVDGHSHFDFKARSLRLSVERSLRRLKTDYIDCVLLHSDGNDMDILTQTDALATLLELKQKGLIRQVGLSGKTIAGGLEAFRLGADSAMVTYNLKQREELPVIEAAAAQQKGIFIKKAFASGHLDQQIADPVAASLALSLETDGVSSIVAGTINPSHLAENVAKARAICESA